MLTVAALARRIEDLECKAKFITHHHVDRELQALRAVLGTDQRSKKYHGLDKEMNFTT
jgi:hypothetical protein